MPGVTLHPFSGHHAGPFRRLADREGWVILPWEIQWLLDSFPQGCFAAIGEDGSPCGFVTACRHRSSGWIGNLIVEERFRGRGIGTRLFSRALQALTDAGVETVWLTASEAGRGIYERLGFTAIDTILRHAGTFPEGNGMRDPLPPPDEDPARIDSDCWGDDRSSLIRKTAQEGVLCAGGGGFLILQPLGDRFMIGPWGGKTADEAREMFTSAGTFFPSVGFFVDTPAGNREATRFLSALPCRTAGETLLMWRGKRPDYRPDMIWGLATMGSCG